MLENAGLTLLTTAEAADYLRIKERKLYELVAEAAIPCTKVSGKWLFPRAELDRWLLAGMTRPPGLAPADPPPILGGSHDPLLQWALAECRAGIAMLPEGSEAGFRRFLNGEVIATAIHFHDVNAPGSDANVRIVSTQTRLYDSVLIGFAGRTQGFLVAPGNPLKIATIGDALAAKARLVMRPQGAGAQQLLEALMKQAGFSDNDLPASAIVPTGPDVAQAIRLGHCDVGIATEAVALAGGAGFVPLVQERFDLLMRQRDAFRPQLQKLLAFMRSAGFAAQAKELGGLDVSAAGQVRWAP